MNIQDEAYGEAMGEIKQLQHLNKEERKTIVALSFLILRAIDALETYPTWGRPGIQKLINELREAIQ